MAAGEGETEKFLLDKLQAGIDRKVPYSNKFKESKKLLENQLKSAKDEKQKVKIREKLHLLNNLMTKSSSISDYLSWHLISGLHRIKKDIRSASKKGAAGEDQPAATATAGRSTRTMATKQGQGLGLRLDADTLVVGNLVLYRRRGRFEDFNAVGIVGAEGVGKTTLARSIFDEEEVKNEFLPRIWISLSEQPDDEKDTVEIAIAKRILLALGVAGETINNIRPSATKDAEIRPNTEIATATNNQAAQPSTSTLSKMTSKLRRSFTRANNQAAAEEAERKAAVEKKAAVDSKRPILGALISAIRQELMGKRYLIVLDDASEAEEWYRDLSVELTPERKQEEKLGFAFPKGSGGTVLVTGMAEHVVKGMVGGDGMDIYRLLPLEEPKLYWKMYKEATEEDGRMEAGDDKEKEVKEEVVKRCNGLPAAAVLMGEIRKMVEREEKEKSQQTAITGGTHQQPAGR